MAREKTTQREMWLALGRVSRLFRLNTGLGWISNIGPKGVQKMQNGAVLIHDARPIPLGFANVSGEPIKGACDLPGWTSVVITPEMVGRTVAVFTSIEAKGSTGRPTDDQRNWMEQVVKAGGIAGIVRSGDEALAIVEQWKRG